MKLVPPMTCNTHNLFALDQMLMSVRLIMVIVSKYATTLRGPLNAHVMKVTA